jgi:hypothetical protein
MSCSLAQAIRDELTNQDHALLISIPASLYFKVLALISWHYRTTTRTAITSVPPFDHSATEQWALQCRSAFSLLELKPLRRRTQLDEALQNDLEWLHTQAPALVSLQSTLRLHSGRSTELLGTPAGRSALRQHLSLAQLSVPAPADWSLRASSEAKCKVCGIYEHDRMDLNEGVDVELRVYNCIACMGWWHFTCLTEEDRQSLPSDLIQVENVEDGVAPPWRCKDCVKSTNFAVQRILEVLRDEEGRFYFVLEYLGYRVACIRQLYSSTRRRVTSAIPRADPRFLPELLLHRPLVEKGQ